MGPDALGNLGPPRVLSLLPGDALVFAGLRPAAPIGNRCAGYHPAPRPEHQKWEEMVAVTGLAITEIPEAIVWLKRT